MRIRIRGNDGDMALTPSRDSRPVFNRHGAKSATGARTFLILEAAERDTAYTRAQQLDVEGDEQAEGMLELA
jgi:hypothetical protein